VKRIAAGANEIIELGDISVKKEWTFAGDVAKGIFTLLNRIMYLKQSLGQA